MIFFLQALDGVGGGLIDLNQTIQPSGYRAGQVARSVRCVPCKQEDPSLVLGTYVLCFLFSVFLPLIDYSSAHYNLTTTEVETGNLLATHLIKSQWEALSQKKKVDST